MLVFWFWLIAVVAVYLLFPDARRWLAEFWGVLKDLVRTPQRHREAVLRPDYTAIVRMERELGLAPLEEHLRRAREQSRDLCCTACRTYGGGIPGCTLADPCRYWADRFDRFSQIENPKPEQTVTHKARDVEAAEVIHEVMVGDGTVIKTFTEPVEHTGPAEDCRLCDCPEPFSPGFYTFPKVP